MEVYLWLFLAATSAVTATHHPRQLSPCQVVDMDVYCNDMNLRAIPGELPTGIHKLDLSHNLLQNLTRELMPFYTTVNHLIFHANKIQFIQPGLFTDMANLQVLDLSKNYLDIFAASKNEIGPLLTVKQLDLSGNGLYTGMTDYFLHDAPTLLNLSLDGNSITKISKDTFSGSTALRKIDLHNNVILEIEDGAFDSLLDLSELDLSMNSITCITDFNLPQLKLLNLSKNSMESFQTTDSDTEYELQYLDLRENKIHYFPIVPRRNKLMYLDLSRNLLRGINTIPPAEELELMSDSRFPTHPQTDHKNIHNDLSRLLYLDMSYNQIKSIPSSFFNYTRSLEVLNLSNNCLEAFSVNHLSPLNSLKILDLSFNALQNLSFGENTLQSLEELYLTANNLRAIDSAIFYRLPSIRELHLQHNFLRICGLLHRPPQRSHHLHSTDCIIFSSVHTLRSLYLSGNSIEFVPQCAFHGSPLAVLDLSQNPGLILHKNAFTGLESSLTYLSLRGNDLHVLNTDLFVLSSLRDVDLSDNKLTSLPLWNKESAIQSLNLQNNCLVILEYNTMLVLERTLKTLYLGSNPLSCCTNTRFLQMVQRSTVDIPDIASVTCQYTQDSEQVEISITSVSQEHCEMLNRKSLSIIVIIITSLVLIAVLVLLSKLCHPRRHRLRGSFKA
ncbi:leucine-rich repeat-containing protein 32-like [Scleropages formosus]|nr:transforming growth factor beta activator LRRC32 [Scleropages formosus]XP_018610550.2 transforming growth factor beta activator LRRC32 [Scleropages formosus]XP_018610551.2 transforming growth factor beta activator LRRC32 [Scleropages formosus]KPP63613.1 leucine-rich repeat-containing protein 32-like [Scleropages formosus]